MSDDGTYGGHERGNYAPSGLLPADEYTTKLQALRGLTTTARGQVETESSYGHTQTWLVETHRVPDAGDWVFLQRVGQGVTGPEALRLVFPPQVVAMLNRQRDTLTAKNRTKAAKQAARTRRANGHEPGAVLRDPKVRAKALIARKRKAAARRARKAAATV
jgi:hypothetical protein